MRRVQSAKWMYTISSLLLCVLGVVVMIWPSLSARIICYLFGGVMFFYGATKLWGYFSRDIYRLAFQFDLALGILLCIMGVIFILHPNAIISMFPVIIGLLVLIDGVFKVQTAFDAKRFGLREWWLILVGALLCAGLGLLLLFDPFAGSNWLMVLVGVSLLLDGVQNLFNALYTVKITRRRPKEDNCIEIHTYIER